MKFCRFKTLRRQAITLMEIMIVIALFSLVSGVLAVNANRLLREERFQKESALIQDKIKLAIDLTLLFDVESEIQFVEKEDAIALAMAIENGGSLSRLLNGKEPISLRAIHFIEFDDFRKENERGKLSLKFLSSGSLLPKGILRLSTSRSDKDLGAITHYIHLPGYPAPIKTYKNDEISRTLADEGESLDQKLTRYLVDEISSLNFKSSKELSEQTD